MKLENFKGSGIGVVFGAVIGLLLSMVFDDVFPFDNIGVAIALGAGIGAAFGTVFDKKNKDNNSINE